MPMLPLRPCSVPGCGGLGAQGRCEKHPRKDTRPNATQRGYGTDWRALRPAILKRDPVCVECRLKPSKHVDHITPRAAGGTDAPTNLQGLCHSCHSRKTAKGDGSWGNPLQHKRLA